MEQASTAKPHHRSSRREHDQHEREMVPRNNSGRLNKNEETQTRKQREKSNAERYQCRSFADFSSYDEAPLLPRREVHALFMNVVGLL